MNCSRIRTNLSLDGLQSLHFAISTKLKQGNGGKIPLCILAALVRSVDEACMLAFVYIYMQVIRWELLTASAHRLDTTSTR